MKEYVKKLKADNGKNKRRMSEKIPGYCGENQRDKTWQGYLWKPMGKAHDWKGCVGSVRKQASDYAFPKCQRMWGSRHKKTVVIYENLYEPLRLF